MKHPIPSPRRRVRVITAAVVLAGLLNATQLSPAAPTGDHGAPTVPARAPLPAAPAPRASPSVATGAGSAVASPPVAAPAVTPPVAPPPAATRPAAAAPHDASAHTPAPAVNTPQAVPPAAPSAHEAHDGPSPDEALAALRSGNERFIDGILSGPRRDEDRRIETAAGQHPIAGILSCADSRVPVEVVFDQGIGDLFVVRVAGNIAGTSELASLEYGVEHLNLPLVVVMGHTRCGAVKAALSGAAAHGPLGELLSQITPSVDAVKGQNIPEAARLAATVRANVRYTLAQLQKDPVIAEAVAAGKTRLVGAVYDIGSGVVQWIDAAPPVGAAADPELVKPAATAAPAAPSGPRLARPVLPTVPSHDDKPSSHSTLTEPHSSATPKHSTDEHASAAHSDAAKPESADSAHAEADTAEKPATASTAKRDNWVMLGSMLAGASGLSIGVIQWLGARKAK